jgi:hypothetical protein
MCLAPRARLITQPGATPQENGGVIQGASAEGAIHCARI